MAGRAFALLLAMSGAGVASPALPGTVDSVEAGAADSWVRGTADSSAAAPVLELPTDSMAVAAPLGFDRLLQGLDFPRERPAELERARQVLAGELASSGLVPRTLPFEYRPGRVLLAAVAWLAAAGLLAWGSLSGAWKGIAGAAALASLGALGLAGGLDGVLPARPGANLEVVIEPRGVVRREVLLGAHYDSKTELLDHTERGLLVLGTLWAAFAALLVSRSRPRAARVLGAAAAAGLAAGGAHFASGLAIGARGHGIVDDAAACALLVEQAQELHERPLESTRVWCVWWAAEEHGAQGSHEFVRATALRPAAVVNLECIGAGPRVGILGIEWTGSRLEPPDASLVASLQRAASTRLSRVPAPSVTDTGPWLGIDVPAVTLLNLRANGLPARGLHSAQDRIEAIDREGVDAVRAVLGAWLARADSGQP